MLNTYNDFTLKIELQTLVQTWKIKHLSLFYSV